MIATRRTVRLVIVAALVAAITVPMVTAVTASRVGASGTRPSTRETARRVLIFAMPYVSWTDLHTLGLPNLSRVVDAATVAGLSTRVHDRATALGDGYATIGAGSRTVATRDAELGGSMVDEPFGAVTAGDAYRQRTGVRPSGAIVQTGIVGLLGANARLDYDSEVGALADALARANVDTAVIGNGDGEEPDAARTDTDATPGPAHQRAAVLGLMDSAGQVAHGRVDGGLLRADPAAPFGVRLDDAEVLDAFRDAWVGRTVVLVEASDLIRVARYEPYVTARQHERQRRAAVRDADRLLGALLDQVDPARDLVMIVGPAHAPDAVTLTPFAVRGPGYEPGLARSATTRRSGFVQIQDLAPTILQALGIDAPASMEGNPVEVGDRHGDPSDRLAYLRDADAAARFRDARIGEFYAVLVAAAVVVAAMALAACWWRPTPRWEAAAVLAALWGLGLLTAAFLVRLAPLHEAGVGGFYAVLIGVGALVALACRAVGGRRPLDALLAATVAIVGVLTVDVLRGAPLVLNSVLGYSPTVAGRFAGFGNPAYAAYAASALVVATVSAHRIGGRRGRLVAGGILVAAVVVDVAPMWGSDVGGILSMVPAYALTMVLMTGRRIRPAVAGAAIVAALLVGATAAGLDLARPAEDRTHLGRFVERVRDGGIGEAWSVIERKASANLATVGTSILGLVLALVVVGAVVVWRRDRARVTAVFGAVPEWRSANVGFVVLAGLGFAFNDSGMTVPGVMLVVFVCAWAYLLVVVGRRPPGSDARLAAGKPDATSGMSQTRARVGAEAQP